MTVERFFIDEAKKAHDIEKFLESELTVAGFSHAEVKKTPLGTRIIIHVLRPGIVIGGGGSNIQRLTSFVGSKFGLENPHLEVEQVKDAFLDPHVVAWRVARSLEKGAYFKRVANITLQRVVQVGAKGVEIRLGGKLPSSRAKTWIFTSGKLRKCGQDAIDQVQVAYSEARTKMGTIGVKVSILPPEAEFSDEIRDKIIEVQETKIEEKPKTEGEAEPSQAPKPEKPASKPEKPASEPEPKPEKPASKPEKPESKPKKEAKIPAQKDKPPEPAPEKKETPN